VEWLGDAGCRSIDPEVFFPPKGASGPAIEVAMARAVCRHCSVRDECREWGIATEPEAGVWGGMTVRELRTLGVQRRDGRRTAQPKYLGAGRATAP